ncbi:MAG: hypothetical protein ACPGED_03640, partial [Flavobacteriales bacterium]
LIVCINLWFKKKPEAFELRVYMNMILTTNTTNILVSTGPGGIYHSLQIGRTLVIATFPPGC